MGRRTHVSEIGIHSCTTYGSDSPKPLTNRQTNAQECENAYLCESDIPNLYVGNEEYAWDSGADIGTLYKK